MLQKVYKLRCGKTKDLCVNNKLVILATCQIFGKPIINYNIKISKL